MLGPLHATNESNVNFIIIIVFIIISHSLIILLVDLWNAFQGILIVDLLRIITAYPFYTRCNCQSNI